MTAAAPLPNQAAALRGLIDADRPRAAMAAARAALAQTPDDAPLLHAASRVAHEAVEIEAARDWLDAAMRLAPKEPVLWVDRALLAAAMGEAKAFGKMAKAAALPPAFLAALGEVAGGRGARPRSLGAATPAMLTTAQTALDKGNAKAAEAALAPALSRPGAVPLALLAQARQARGDLRGAAQVIAQAVRSEPWCADLRRAQAQITARAQGPAAALSAAIEAARLAPKAPAPAILAARLALASGARRHLPRLAARALALAPRDPGALTCAAEAAMGPDPQAALRHARRLPQSAPGRAILIARAHAAAGHDEEALAAYGTALTEAPTDLSALTGRAQLLQSLGQGDLAETDLRAAIRAHPQAGMPLRALAYGTRLAPDDPALEVMRAATEGPDGRLAHYALARALEPVQPDQAAQHLARAKALQAEAFPFDPAPDIEELARLTGPLWDGLRGCALSGSAAAPIFVTGLPRSGTTLVERVLAAHPSVRGGGELGLLNGVLAPVYDALEAGETPDLEAAAQSYATAVEGKVGPGRVTDKSIHSFLHIGAIARTLPNAAIVVVRRDPRDTGLSIWKNHFPDGTHRYAATMEGIAEHIALFEAAMAHWRAALPGAFHEIAYEDLLADPEGRSRALLEACGLDWDAAVLRFHEAGGRVDTLSFDQVRRPMTRASVGGWRKHEATLRPLIQALERRGLLPEG